MASMLSRGAILAECLVKNSTPKVNIRRISQQIYGVCTKVKAVFEEEKNTMVVMCHVY